MDDLFMRGQSDYRSGLDINYTKSDHIAIPVEYSWHKQLIAKRSSDFKPVSIPFYRPNSYNISEHHIKR
jgi:hypothetical protein